MADLEFEILSVIEKARKGNTNEQQQQQKSYYSPAAYVYHLCELCLYIHYMNRKCHSRPVLLIYNHIAMEPNPLQ